MDRAAKLALRALDREFGPRLCQTRQALAEARRAHYVAAIRYQPRHVPNGKVLRYAECRAMLEPDSELKERFLAAAHAEVAARLARLEAEAAYWRARQAIVAEAGKRRGGTTYLDQLQAVQFHYRSVRALAEAGYLGATGSITIYRRMRAAGAFHG